MARLTDTQLVILCAASQRDDRGVELPANIKGEAARKVVDKLIRAGLLEEVGAAGSLPIWRRDDDSGPMALRITKQGLEAIDVEDEATGAPNETSVCPAPACEAEAAAAKAVASRQRISAASPRPAHTETTAAKPLPLATPDPPRPKKGDPGSKQSRVISHAARREIRWVNAGGL